METHLITTSHDLEKIGMRRCEYARELFYGPLLDRIRRSGAYIDPVTEKIMSIRIMTGNSKKKLFNSSFSQYVSTEKVVWNLPDWQHKPGCNMNVNKGDSVDIFVSVGLNLQTMDNFFAGSFVITDIQKGRPTKITFIRHAHKQDGNIRVPP